LVDQLGMQKISVFHKETKQRHRRKIFVKIKYLKSAKESIRLSSIFEDRNRFEGTITNNISHNGNINGIGTVDLFQINIEKSK